MKGKLIRLRYFFIQLLLFFLSFCSQNLSEKISLNKNIKPLHIPTEISHIEMVEAEQKTEEKKEIILENQPLINKKKKTNVIDKILNRIWYTIPISDEDDSLDETQTNKLADDLVEKKIIAPDIDTSHTIDIDNQESEIIKDNFSTSNLPWINHQVYGDKVSVE